jgi:hypothetical protein
MVSKHRHEDPKPKKRKPASRIDDDPPDIEEPLEEEPEEPVEEPAEEPLTPDPELEPVPVPEPAPAPVPHSSAEAAAPKLPQPIISTSERIDGSNDVFAFVYKWMLMRDEFGMPVDQFVMASLQAEGMFGGSKLVMEGSNDGVNFHAFDELTEPAIRQIGGLMKMMRPHVIGGDDTTSIYVTAMVRRVR